MLTFDDFREVLAKQAKADRDARVKIEDEIRVLIKRQDEHLSGLERQLELFEKAQTGMETQSKVHATVRQAEELSTEIGQLQRIELYLEISIKIETLK